MKGGEGERKKRNNMGSYKGQKNDIKAEERRIRNQHTKRIRMKRTVRERCEERDRRKIGKIVDE